MKREDWEQLDKALMPAGFGGYYDLMECLYTIAGKCISPKLEERLRDNKEGLKTTINVLMTSKKRSKRVVVLETQIMTWAKEHKEYFQEPEDAVIHAFANFVLKFRVPKLSE